MKEEYKELKELQKRYLTRLSDLYPTIAAASTEIINLQAILPGLKLQPNMAETP